MYLTNPKPRNKEAAVQGGFRNMRIRSVARVVLYGVIALAIVGVGCKHPAPVTPAVAPAPPPPPPPRSEEHTSELQSLTNLVCRLLLEKKNKKKHNHTITY